LFDIQIHYHGYNILQTSIKIGYRSLIFFIYITDDCGVWESSSGKTVNHDFIISEDNKLKTVYKRDGMFCSRKNINKRVVYSQLNPQPTEGKFRVQEESNTCNTCPGKDWKKSELEPLWNMLR